MAGEPNLEKAKGYLERCGFVGLTEKFDLSLHMLEKLSPLPLNLNYKRRRAAPSNMLRQALESDPHKVELARQHNQLDWPFMILPCGKFFRNSARGPGSPRIPK